MKKFLIVALSLISLSAFAGSPNLNMNGHKIINAANPTSPQDVATQSYVESYVATHAGSGGGGSIGNTGVTPGAYGDGTHVATFTVQADGRLALAGTATISIPSSAISGSTSIGRNILVAADIPTEQALLNVRPGVDIEVYDSDLAALAALTFSADRCVYWTGAAAPALYTCTAAGRAWAALADAAAQTAALNVFTSSLKGLVPSGGNSAQCLHGDGTWSTCTGGSGSINTTTAETTTPAPPTSGSVATWVSSTDHRFHDEDSTGVKGTTVIASTASTNQCATGVSTAGVIQYTTASALAFSGAMSDMGTFNSSTLFSRITDEVGSGHVLGDTSPIMSGATLNGTTTLGGALTCGGNNITNIGVITFKYVVDGNKSGASPIIADFTVATDHTFTINGTFSGTPTWNWPTLSAGQIFYAREQVCQDTIGSRSMSWPSSPTLVWLGTATSSTPPTLSTTANACDYVSFRYDGTTITGYLTGSSTGSTGLPTTGGTMSGPIAMGGNNITNIQDMSFKVGTGSITGANPLLADWTTGNTFIATATGSMSGTPTFTAPTLGSGQATVLRLLILQNSTGGFSLPAWPANVKWQGTAPSIPTAANAAFWVTFVYYNSVYYGSYGQSAVGWN